MGEQLDQRVEELVRVDHEELDQGVVGDVVGATCKNQQQFEAEILETGRRVCHEEAVDVGEQDGHLLLGAVEADEEVDQVKAGELDALLVNGSDDTDKSLKSVEHSDLVGVGKVGNTLVEQGVQVFPHPSQLVGLQLADLRLIRAKFKMAEC